MAIEQIIVPSPGESVTEGRIAKWYVNTGAAVKIDEPLFELESDKAAQTVYAKVAGVLKVTVVEGEIVPIGAIVGEIDAAGTPSATAAPAAAKPTPVNSTTSSPAAPTTSSPAEVRTSPSAGRILAERGIDARDVQGSGPNGLVIKDDALAHSTKSTPTAQPTPATLAKPVSAISPAAATQARELRQPMSMIRRRISERLLESQQNTATLTTFNEVDLSAFMELRTKYNERFEKKHGVKLGFMSLFVKASVEALKAFPIVNARIDGTDIVYQNFFDISVAVSTDKGLTVPVIRNCDDLSFADIEKAIGELAKKAKDNKISPQDMMGGTFTITNGGIFGSMMSTPILNPPQSAILGMHSTQKRAVVVNDQIVIRPMMYIALSYDHRLIDGREAVQFLVRIKECVENPERMLFEI